MTISQQPTQDASALGLPKSFRVPSRPYTTLATEQNPPVWQTENPETSLASLTPPVSETGVASSTPPIPKTGVASSTPPVLETGVASSTPSASETSPASSTPPVSELPPPTTPPPLSPPQQSLPNNPPIDKQDTAPMPVIPSETLMQKNTVAEFQTKALVQNLSSLTSKLPAIPPILTKLAKERRKPLFIGLAAMIVVVVISGVLGQIWAANSPNGPLNYPSDGPYAQLPLSASQINQIQHLAGHMKYKALASLYVSHMSLDDKIGQLIMIEYNQPSYSDDLDYMINTLHVGGVIMYEFQMTSFNQTKSDIARMQQRANIPLVISTDEEGGPYVHRLSSIYGYRMSATDIEQTGSTDVARQQGLKTSRDLAALGINEDLAPDVDVNQVNGYDMITRTFGETPDQVVKFAGAYMQAMQGNGTIACIKHFPGLGGASPDAHKTLPVVNSSREQIYNVDLAPFKAFIQSPNALLNPGMIMPTDVLMPAIDAKYPGELSHIFMTDILRKEFGFDGVSLTDALYMQGITNTWDMYTASILALQAGNDMLLGVNGTSQTVDLINTIKQALKDGQLTKARIDESVTRIIALKMQYHLMPTYNPAVS
jgi:beta-N-acetylhexosaminidase